jgi:aldose 1-epimerase
MSFEVRIAQKKAGDRSGEVYELVDSGETVRAEVWPQWGFNCLRWQLRQQDGRWADIFFAAPDWETNPVPTRSGHPILFPFPGRLRHGAFAHDGKTYTLPLNDSTKQHAIHGFTPRTQWRVSDWKGADGNAAVTGQFSLKEDLPEAVVRWPVDFNLTVTYRLYRDRLRVEAHVVNLGPGTLPFGLGYHPYIRLPGATEADVGRHILRANVSEVWEAADNLPTGRRIATAGAIDFRRQKPIGKVELDHVFTGIDVSVKSPDGLIELAELSHPLSPGRVGFFADAAFRELVLFTPTHRQAIAIEPYTCPADAANLAARGIDSGWLVVSQSATWRANVEYRWLSNE